MVCLEKSSSSPKKLPHGRRHDASLSSSIGATTSSNNILDSVTGISHSSNVNPPTIATLLGLTAASGTSVVQEIRPPGTAKGNTDWYETCTESLGYESLAEKKDVCDFSEVMIDDVSSSRSKVKRVSGVIRQKTNLKDFPPLISTLDSSGRPRFSYKKVTDNDGRLSVNMMESDRLSLY